MNLIELSLKDGEVEKSFNANLPDSWQEVPQEKIYTILSYIGKYDSEEAKFRSFKLLISIPKEIDLRLLNPSDMYFLSQKMNFLLLGTHRQLIPSFKIGHSKYYGPADKFEDGSNMEWWIAEDLFNKLWAQKDKKESLVFFDQLVMCLYRRSSGGNQGRLPLTGRGEIKHRVAGANGKIPPEVRTATFYYWVGIRALAKQIYGNWIFKSSKKEDGQEEEKKEMDFGWGGICQDVAETGIYGTLDQVLQENFHSTCLYLVRKEELFKKAQNPQKTAKDDI